MGIKHSKEEFMRKIKALGFRVSVKTESKIYDIEAYRGDLILKAENPNYKKALRSILEQARKQDIVQQAIKLATRPRENKFYYFGFKHEPCHLVLDIDEVFPLEQGVSHKKFYGYYVRVDSIKLKVFNENELICVSCGTAGAFLEINEHNGYYHLNLYGYLGHKKVLFTIDHIIPKSRGGSNTRDNLQVMCQYCNQEKGNKIYES